MGEHAGHWQSLSRGYRSGAGAPRAARPLRLALFRRCRSRITTASTPIWAAASMHAPPASRSRMRRRSSRFRTRPARRATPRCRTRSTSRSRASATAQVAVEITDSDSYPQTGTLALTVDLPAGTTLELRAADGDASDAAARRRDQRLRRGVEHLLPERPAHRRRSGHGAGQSSPAALVHVPAQAARRQRQPSRARSTFSIARWSRAGRSIQQERRSLAPSPIWSWSRRA